MCSRNGTPIANLALPVPSRLIETLIWVSRVLRSTDAVCSAITNTKNYPRKKADIIRSKPPWRFAPAGWTASCTHPGISRPEVAIMHERKMPATLRFMLAARRSELLGLEDPAQTCELVTRISQLVHALQKERRSAPGLP